VTRAGLVTPGAAVQGALELRATDAMGGAAPDGVTVSGTVSRGGKALAGAPLAFAAAGGGAFRADAQRLGLTPGVYTCAPSLQRRCPIAIKCIGACICRPACWGMQMQTLQQLILMLHMEPIRAGPLGDAPPPAAPVT